MEKAKETIALRSRRNQQMILILVGLSVLSLALVVALGVFASEEGQNVRSLQQSAPAKAAGPTPPQTTDGASDVEASALSNTFAEIIQKVTPAVVNISTEQVSRPRGTPFDEFFERFFGGPLPEQRRRSLGSGVIVDGERFYILTNHHVVHGAQEIDVQLSDKTTVEAKLVGSDPLTDLAVVKIADRAKKNAPIPSAILGDSDDLVIGDWVLAIGNPFGIGQTVTAGIISAKSRVIGQGPYDDFLQTDAAINPGNSGGPLVNLEGEVIGINSAIVSRSGGNMGIGFAIPSNMASNIYTQIVETGSVTRGWLGVSVQNLSPALAAGFGMEGKSGALISDVLGEDSPAAKAGLKAGDVIVEFDGEPVESSRELTRLVADVRPGETVEVEYYRDGNLQATRVTVAEREDQGRLASVPGEERTDRGRLGIQAQNLTSQIASQLGTSSKTGVVITHVNPSGPAAHAGLQQGDIIHEANRKSVENLEQLRSVLQDVPEGGNVLLRIERATPGQSGFLYVSVELD